MRDISLYYTEGGSDKEYHLHLTGTPGILNWAVSFEYGRRGSAASGGTKIQGASEAKGRQVFDKFIREKVGKGYTLLYSGTPFTTTIEEAIASTYNQVNIRGDTDRVMQDAEERLGTFHQVGRDPTPEESSLHTGNRDMDLGLAPEPERQFTVVGSRRVTWAGRKATQTVEEAEVPAVRRASALTVPLHSQQPNPIEEEQAQRLLENDSFGMQDKYDGKKITVRVIDGHGQAFNKKGETATPKNGPVTIPRQMMDDIIACGKDLEVDGEQIGQKYVVYDILSLDGKDLRNESYQKRHSKIPRAFNGGFGESITVAPLYVGTEAKRARYEETQRLGGEGVVFKRLAARFTEGRPASGGDMLKRKFYATASFFVIDGREGKRSVGVAVLDGTAVVPVGNVTISNKVENGQLIPVPVQGDIIEVRYLYAFRGGSLYQPTYLGQRDDVSREECLISQLKYKQEVDNG